MKKLLTLLLSGIMIAASIPMGTGYTAEAAPNAAIDSKPAIVPGGPGGSTADPSDAALESAIKAVKAKVTIPKEYSSFNYYFYDTKSYIESYWSLTWTNPTDNTYIQVNCDINNHITYYVKNDYSAKKDNLPVYLKKDLKDTADKFIQQIAPEIFAKLQYMDASYEGVYSGNYVYHYQRVENGIALPENTVDIGVNSITGEVKSANLLWLYGVTVPSADTKLTKDQATATLKKNMTMKLEYLSDFYRIYDAVNPNAKYAFLVYEPSVDYISVDAKTGKVYLTKSEWVDYTSANQSENAAAAVGATKDSSAPTATLTEEEIAKVEELKNLITKDKAIKAVTGNKYLYLDKNLTSYTATLYKYYNYNTGADSYVWNIQLVDPRKVDAKAASSYRAYASAQVDAKTGKIVNFYASVKSYYDEKTGKWQTVKITYDKKKCQTNLETFLKSQIGSKLANSKLVNTKEDYVAYYRKDTPVYGGYNYQYNRTNQGIEFANNSINGSVDGITGKIYSFGYQWDDGIVFETSKGAMSAEKAMDNYLSKTGYGLVYEINQINTIGTEGKPKAADVNTDSYNVKYEIRLVYRPNINPSTLSPFTGDQLGPDGKVYKEVKPYVYKDVQDTPENKEILLLADMNIGFEGDYFYPTKEITKGELYDLMQKVGYGYANQDISNLTLPLTREEAAQNFIDMLGFGRVSAISGIYRTGYADEQSIDQKYLGAVAIAKGLGLMQGDSSNNFNPKKSVTRADAVHLILNFIKVQQAGIYY